MSHTPGRRPIILAENAAENVAAEVVSDFASNTTSDDAALLREVTAHSDDARAIRQIREQQSVGIRILNGNNMRQNVYYRIIWYKNVIPLPVINYLLIWQTYGPRDIKATFKRVSRIALAFALKALRLLVFASNLYHWSKALLSDGSLATFSEKYFGDILSYSFRNYPGLAERHCEMFLNRRMVPELKDWKSTVYDTVAWNLGMSYYFTDGSVACKLNDGTLIFKFSNAVTKSAVLNWLPPTTITFVTVCIYVLYGVAAMLIKLNIAIMYGVNITNRLMPTGLFFVNLVKSLWYQTAPSLF